MPSLAGIPVIAAIIYPTSSRKERGPAALADGELFAFLAEKFTHLSETFCNLPLGANMFVDLWNYALLRICVQPF